MQLLGRKNDKNIYLFCRTTSGPKKCKLKKKKRYKKFLVLARYRTRRRLLVMGLARYSTTADGQSLSRPDFEHQYSTVLYLICARVRCQVMGALELVAG